MSTYGRPTHPELQATENDLLSKTLIVSYNGFGSPQTSVETVASGYAEGAADLKKLASNRKRAVIE